MHSWQKSVFCQPLQLSSVMFFLCKLCKPDRESIGRNIIFCQESKDLSSRHREKIWGLHTRRRMSTATSSTTSAPVHIPTASTATPLEPRVVFAVWRVDVSRGQPVAVTLCPPVVGVCRTLAPISSACPVAWFEFSASASASFPPLSPTLLCVAIFSSSESRRPASTSASGSFLPPLPTSPAFSLHLFDHTP